MAQNMCGSKLAPAQAASQSQLGSVESRIAEATAHLNQYCEALEKLAERLYGPVPEKQHDGAQLIGGPGIMNSFVDRLDNLDRGVQRLDRVMSTLVKLA